MKILLIDDDEDDYVLMREMVSAHASGDRLPGFELDWASSYEQALQAFSDARYDAYLIDYRLGPHSGLDLLREQVVRDCPKPIIMLTGHEDYAVDTAAMELGAADYLVKGHLTLSLLERSVRYAIERRQVQRDLQRLVQERTRDLALLEKQAQEMNALQKATASLLSTLDFSLLMGQILDAALEAIPSAEDALLCLVDQPAGRGSQVTNGLKDPRIYRLKPSDDPRDPITDLGNTSTVLISDAPDHPLLRAVLPDDDRRSVRSAVIAPLARSGQVFGALCLTSPWTGAFSESAQRLLTSFATTATAAMYNAILYREIQNLAKTDPLTGQFNRRTFFELGQREIDRAQRFGRPLSAIMLDVDWFKLINDTYGHAAGDQVLIGIVERCRSVIRHVDVLGRYGGDEFAILLPEAAVRLAAQIASRLQASVSASAVSTDAGLIPVTISIGIAQSTPETTDVSLLLKRADQALYQSKQAGKDRITIYNERAG